MFQAGSCFDWNVLQASLRPINHVLGLVRLDKAEEECSSKNPNFNDASTKR